LGTKNVRSRLSRYGSITIKFGAILIWRLVYAKEG